MINPPFSKPTATTDAPPRMTYEEFLAWVPDGKQAEWVDGEVRILTTNARHVRLSRLLVNVLSSFVALFDLGEVFPAPFLMRATPNGPGREPDVMVVLRRHLHRVQRLGIDGPVDMAIELISPESVTTDRIEKLREYEAGGIPEYLILDARVGRFRFEFYRLNARGSYEPVPPDAEGRYQSYVLPGLWLDPRWFVQDPLPEAEELLLLIAPEEYTNWITVRLGRR